ncbi:ATP-binding cassette domain-containing protein [Gracilibacillus caseinilyticus]|uniref:ATP-binding cassette domain-containing protein n=1 Tax=Gracilibacillus caseinilyticus TaxID=2932256 RepID=A0ABY4ETB7_9BACI|nr:ABC transporter ATP-binding protein [Gracilibacillus caseinilyticus]UOQ47663.1 ATP-binding cassette domain-containing protein [Gracilibacillus caseinilyticus]
MIEINHLKAKYPGQSRTIINDFSLSIQEEEKVLLIGPSGSGKSTIMQILAGLIPEVIEIPLKYQSRTLPDAYGIVFQDPDAQFCMPYVDEEIAFVLENRGVAREKMPDLITKYLEQVGLSFADNHIPIQHLSGGMKQRLAIATVLALEPSVIFLDEPTAMLDDQGTVDVWDTIKKVAANKTIIIVEHKIEHILSFVDRVIMIDESGNILGDDTPEAIFTKFREKLYRYGVWYPKIWHDFLAQRANPKPSTHILDLPVIRLDSLKGYHLKKLKMEVEKATIYQGDWLAVTGENGSGKSTLLLAIMQLIRTKGNIYYYLSEKSTNCNYQKMGYVFQNPELQFIANSVYEELAQSLVNSEEEVLPETIEQHLKRYHLFQVKDQHPYELSVGQKRRLSVATATIANVDVLLLDEPTFGQDAKNTFAMLDMLDACRKNGITIVMVTHQNEIVRHFATREWRVQEGQVQEMTAYPLPIQREG